MPDDNEQRDTLDPKPEALEAWSKLPQGTPSRGALPPAGGGLGHFFGWFAGMFDTIRENKVLFAVLAALVIVVVVALRLWQ